MTTLPVFYENRLVGTIEVGATGPSFIYDSEWLRVTGAFPISTAIPLTKTPVTSNQFLPWAANLLPEGGALRRISELFQAAPEDVIKILSEIGRDTAGALSIGQTGSARHNDYKEIKSADDLERIINELPRKPFLAGEEGVSMSLAGVQTKLGVQVLENGNLAIPINGAPSTHILKPNSKEFGGLVQNEAFCLVLADLCGLRTTETTTGKAGSRQYLLVRRYDRVLVQGRWRRIHQEDFCQALGKPPEAKYETNSTGIKGPTAADMMALARSKMSGPDVIALLDYIVFNIAVCNTDAHAKNYSAIITSNNVSLAPIYDVVCTQIWSGITNNLSQSIDGKRKGDHLKRRHWEAFAEVTGFNKTSVISRVRSLIKKIDDNKIKAREIVASMPAGDDTCLDLVLTTIANRTERLRNGLDEDHGIPILKTAENSRTSKTTLVGSADYLHALRKAETDKAFKKIVKALSNDRGMNAADVKRIATEILNQKFTSKKSAVEALSATARAAKSLLS